MPEPQPIFLISGPPGAGKSSVADALMQRFQNGVHIPLDDLREWVVSGMAPPIPTWTNETTRQFHLARQAAAATARLYAQAGFAVAIDDVIFPAEAESIFASVLNGLLLHKVLLRPALSVALNRNARRTNKSFDTSSLEGTIEAVHRSMSVSAFTRSGWTIIDSTHLTLQATVDAILLAI